MDTAVSRLGSRCAPERQAPGRQAHWADLWLHSPNLFQTRTCAHTPFCSPLEGISKGEAVTFNTYLPPGKSPSPKIFILTVIDHIPLSSLLQAMKLQDLHQQLKGPGLRSFTSPALPCGLCRSCSILQTSSKDCL